MRYSLIFIFLFTSILKSQSDFKVQIDTVFLHKELQSLYKRNRLASFSFGIFQGMSLSKTFTYGYQQLSKKEYATSETYYPLASVTKPITASLIVNAVDSGKLQYSDFVNKYIENFPNEITIRDLLVHNTGISRNKNYNQLLKADSLGDIINFIPKKIKSPRKYKYTNINYAFLGRILEKIYNQSFETVAANYFKKVLAEDNEIFFLTKKPDSVQLANSYVVKRRRRYPHKLFVTDIWKPAALAASSSKSLLNFLRIHMNQKYINDILSYPQYVRKRWHIEGKDNEERYGYGFRLLFSDNNLVYIFHNGFMFGALSTIYYIPKYDLGFVAMTNTSGYPKQNINFSSAILSIVRRSIKNKSKLNELNQSMLKIKKY